MTAYPDQEDGYRIRHDRHAPQHKYRYLPRFRPPAPLHLRQAQDLQRVKLSGNTAAAHDLDEGRTATQVHACCFGHFIRTVYHPGILGCLCHVLVIMQDVFRHITASPVTVTTGLPNCTTRRVDARARVTDPCRWPWLHPADHPQYHGPW